MNELIILWEKVLNYFKKNDKDVNCLACDIWYPNLKPIKIKNGTFILSTKLKMVKQALNENYENKILNTVRLFNDEVENILIVLDRNDNSLKNIDTNEKVEEETITESKKNPFLDKFTFDSFISGDSNSFALNAAKAVATDPGKKYNPLFIYSGVGLGKTHLLHAIGNYIFKHNKKIKITYATTEELVNDFLNSINNDKKNSKSLFEEKYKHCDVLMIDDIQFLANKTATQEAFFNLFNKLYNSQKQIIITSDKAPKDLSNLEERLTSRFGCGLIVDIQTPKIETRVAILKYKAMRENFNLTNEVAFYIAEISKTMSIREMEGYLTKIIFSSSLLMKNIETKEMASEVLSEIINEKNSGKSIDKDAILETVSSYFNISIKDIFSSSRKQEIVSARQIAIYLISQNLSIPLSAIGNFFNRDHTTIMHAKNKIENDLKINKKLKLQISDINNQLSKI